MLVNNELREQATLIFTVMMKFQHLNRHTSTGMLPFLLSKHRVPTNHSTYKSVCRQTMMEASSHPSHDSLAAEPGDLDARQRTVLAINGKVLLSQSIAGVPSTARPRALLISTANYTPLQAATPCQASGSPGRLPAGRSFPVGLRPESEEWIREEPSNIAARSAYAFSLNEIRVLVWEDCQWRSSPGEIRLDPSLAKTSKAHRAAVTLPSSSQQLPPGSRLVRTAVVRKFESF